MKTFYALMKNGELVHKHLFDDPESAAYELENLPQLELYRSITGAEVVAVQLIPASDTCDRCNDAGAEPVSVERLCGKCQKLEKLTPEEKRQLVADATEYNKQNRLVDTAASYSTKQPTRKPHQ